MPGISRLAYSLTYNLLDRLGPLRVEKKQRKITRQVRIVKNKEDLVQPTQVYYH